MDLTPPPKTGSSPNESLEFEEQQQGSWLCPSSRSSPKTRKSSPKEAESPTGDRSRRAGAKGNGNEPPNPFAGTYGTHRAAGWVPPSWRKPGTEQFFQTPEKDQYYVKLAPVEESPPYRCLPKTEVAIVGLGWFDKIIETSSDASSTKAGPGRKSGAKSGGMGGMGGNSGGGGAMGAMDNGMGGFGNQAMDENNPFDK